MSSSIEIPQRRSTAAGHHHHPLHHLIGSAASSYTSEASLRTDDVASSPTSQAKALARRPSLMSAAVSKTEHTVINVGNSEFPRLITCVKASQGFDWNQEIFLPSYTDYQFDDLERRQDPVQDIVLTDEEVANMFPK